MNKKILIMLFSILICMSCIVPAFAETYENTEAISYESTEVIIDESSEITSEEIEGTTLGNLWETPTFYEDVLSWGEFEEGPGRLVDKANLIDDTEEAELLAKLDEISKRQGMDIVFVTTNDLEGLTAQEYADDFYDYNGYRYDGVLFLRYLNPYDEEDREVWISTSGEGIYAFTDAGIEHIFDEIENYALSDDYYNLVNKYAELCDEFITRYKEGDPYDIDDVPKKLPFGKWIVTSLIVGVVLALIVTFIMKSQLKTVRKQNLASNYMKPNSMVIANSRDTYLYSHVTKAAIPKSSSSGGSSTHTSSSGRTHGGGGRSI